MSEQPRLTLAENVLRAGSKSVDLETLHEFIDDLAIAEQVLENYEAHGIECTTLYGGYRAKRLRSKTSM